MSGCVRPRCGRFRTPGCLLVTLTGVDLVAHRAAGRKTRRRRRQHEAPKEARGGQGRVCLGRWPPPLVAGAETGALQPCLGRGAGRHLKFPSSFPKSFEQFSEVFKSSKSSIIRSLQVFSLHSNSTTLVKYPPSSETARELNIVGMVSPPSQAPGPTPSPSSISSSLWSSTTRCAPLRWSPAGVIH